MVTQTPAALMPPLRWGWLSQPKADIVWNFAPFWGGYILIAILFAARNLGGLADNPVLHWTVGGKSLDISVWALALYGPLVDAPHLFATVARTYTDREEWASRRRLFLGSLVWFVIGPVVIVAPYVARRVFALPEGTENIGFILWGHFFTFYALFHINKQHWGFVSLYKRKNADLSDPRENRVDALFFYVSIWLPYVGMISAPWFVDAEGRSLGFMHQSAWGTSLSSVVHPLSGYAFLAVCLAYTAYQLRQLARGVPRNGPKLLYLATIIPLQFFAFMLHPFVAAFWVLTTGFGHCAQYHRVVWTYGQSRYSVARDPRKKSLPTSIFSSVWLYASLGLLFGIVAMQGPGAKTVGRKVGAALQTGVFQPLFPFLDSAGALALGMKVAFAIFGGVRLHHFYVDSKIWRVSKNKGLAKDLNLSG